MFTTSKTSRALVTVMKIDRLFNRLNARILPAARADRHLLRFSTRRRKSQKRFQNRMFPRREATIFRTCDFFYGAGFSTVLAPGIMTFIARHAPDGQDIPKDSKLRNVPDVRRDPIVAATANRGIKQRIYFQEIEGDLGGEPGRRHHVVYRKRLTGFSEYSSSADQCIGGGWFCGLLLLWWPVHRGG